MTDKVRVCVVGAGQAAFELAAALRQEKFTGEIVLLGAEPHLPYQRPPLSKAFLTGAMAVDKLPLRSAEWYEKQSVTLMLGARVVSVDPVRRQLEFVKSATGAIAPQMPAARGETLGWDYLVLATGGRARPLAVPGAEAAAQCANWQTLRTLDDVELIRPTWASGAHLVIIGGGYIGLEVAASALKQSLKVSVLEGLERVLARVTAPEVSRFYEQEHRAAGVNLKTGVAVSAVRVDAAAQRVVAVQTSVGEIEADCFLVGIGLLPNVELAEQAGLKVSDGIVVDAALRSTHERVFAIGDCANHPNVWSGRRQRLESVPNAMEQARVVAANIIASGAAGAAVVARVYDAVPWFWSDQYDLKLQMVGLNHGYDRLLLRGQPASRSFTALYLRAGQVISADCIGRPADFMAAKKLVAARVAPTAAQLADDAQPLKSWLPS